MTSIVPNAHSVVEIIKNLIKEVTDGDKTVARQNEELVKQEAVIASVTAERDEANAILESVLTSGSTGKVSE